jgi:hypothetical protein
MSDVTLYISAALSTIWGISHLVPTKNVVAGFGEISEDNRQIITMEWIVEGVSLIFIGLLVALITYLDPNNEISFYVYCLSAAALFALTIVSFFTGYKVNFLPFRMCPFVLSTAGILIILGLIIQG